MLSVSFCLTELYTAGHFPFKRNWLIFKLVSSEIGILQQTITASSINIQISLPSGNDVNFSAAKLLSKRDSFKIAGMAALTKANMGQAKHLPTTERDNDCSEVLFA